MMYGLRVASRVFLGVALALCVGTIGRWVVQVAEPTVKVESTTEA